MRFFLQIRLIPSIYFGFVTNRMSKCYLLGQSDGLPIWLLFENTVFKWYIKGFVTRWIAMEHLENSMNGNGNQSHVSISMRFVLFFFFCGWLLLDLCCWWCWWLLNIWNAHGVGKECRDDDANFRKSLWSTKYSFSKMLEPMRMPLGLFWDDGRRKRKRARASRQWAVMLAWLLVLKF